MNISRKILIVDDEEIIRKLMKHFLVSQGFQVLLASNAREAIDRLQSNKFALIITDLELGHTSGLDVIKETKRIQPETAIFMMTGCREKEYAVAAFSNGADDLLLKPFAMSTLLQRMQHLMEL